MHQEHRAEKHKQKPHYRAMQKLDRLDTNQDGKVDLNEYLSHAESRFNAMDANSDQLVTDEEARQHHENMRKKHREMKKKHKEKVAEEADK